MSGVKGATAELVRLEGKDEGHEFVVEEANWPLSTRPLHWIKAL